MTRNRMWLVVAAAVVVLAVAGTLIGVLYGMRQQDKKDQNGGLTVAQVQQMASAQAALPKCADVFQVGKKVTIADPASGCLDQYGQATLGGWQRCLDGRVFFSFENTVGIPDGYGFVGGDWTALKTHPIGGDAGFGKAYHVCAG